MKNIKNVLATRRSNRGLFLKLSVFALLAMMILLSGQTLAQTPTPTPTDVCNPITTVTEGDLAPGGLASFVVTSGPGSVTIDHVNAGTGLRVHTVVSATNVTTNLPPFTPGTLDPVTKTFMRINPNLPAEFNLRVASSFHAIFIRVQCACTPTLTVTEDPMLPPGGLASFLVTKQALSFTIDHVNAGTGLQAINVLNATNSVVTIPPFTPGTLLPVVGTYSIINPSLPVDITLRARSSFHGVLIRIRCGVPLLPSEPEEGKDSN